MHLAVGNVHDCKQTMSQRINLINIYMTTRSTICGEYIVLWSPNNSLVKYIYSKTTIELLLDNKFL